jgi:hypothetical protein
VNRIHTTCTWRVDREEPMSINADPSSATISTAPRFALMAEIAAGSPTAAGDQ